MKRILFIVVVPLLLSGLSLSSCSETNESLTVAWSPFEQEVLLWIAEDRNMFVRKGLDVTLSKYDTGVGSLDGVLKGEADITVGVTEFPMVGRAFQQSDARIIGAAAKIELLFLVARKDRGIEKVSDLRGKKVGTTFRTVAEFYLGRFLQLNGMDLKDITVVDLRTPAEWENAVADGVVDAIVTAQPYVGLASKRLGSNAVVWPVQGGQYIYGLIVTSQRWVAEHPDAAVRFLKVLAEAEEYAVHNPTEAKTIVQKWMGGDAALVESIWLRDQFSISLDQSLITAMEDEARWLITNNLTAQKQVPNFNDYIHEDALKAVRPDAVNIIR